MFLHRINIFGIEEGNLKKRYESFMYTVNKIFSKHSTKLTPHQERHGWATHGLEAGIYKINEVQYLAGHTSLSSTQIYLNPDQRKMMEKANQQ